MSTASIVPATGELVELAALEPRRLALELTAVNAHLDDVHAYRQQLIDELARRADQRGQRTLELAGVRYEVNAPTEDVYDLRALRANLDALITDGVLAAEILDELIVTPPPKPQPARVAKARVNALLKSDDRRLLAAIIHARRRQPTKRTAKIISVAPDTTATMEPAE